MAKKGTVDERIAKIERALWGENGHKGLIQRQEEDDERFWELYGKYYNAYLYLKTIVNIGKWTTRIIMGIASAIGLVKWKEIWQWFTENFLG